MYKSLPIPVRSAAEMKNIKYAVDIGAKSDSADSHELQNKVAVIAGNNTLTATATALAFAREGADIALIHENANFDRRIQEAVNAFGRRCMILSCDFRNRKSFSDAVETVIQCMGDVDIIVRTTSGEQ